MWKRISVAVVLSSVVVWHVLTTSPKVFASDQTALTLNAIQLTLSVLSTKVSSLDAQVTELGKQERASHAALVRRITDDETKIVDVTNGMADLDAVRQRADYVSIAAQTASNTGKLDRIIGDREKAEAQAKTDHDSTMSWVKAITLMVIGTFLTGLATLGINHLRGNRAEQAAKDASDKQDERLDKLELPPENPEQ